MRPTQSERFPRLAAGWRVTPSPVALLSMLVLAGAGGNAAAVAAQQALEVSVAQGNRRVDVTWPATPELDDALFGGYNVWRAEVPDPEAFVLERRYQRRYPVTWTFCRDVDFPACDPVDGNTVRSFVDADSIVDLIKIEISVLGDSAVTRDYIGIPPHNGFPYYYAVTWFSECLSDRNDTLWIDEPQPEIFEFERGAATLYGFVTESGDTLLVNKVDCRRLDIETSNPVGDPVTIYQGTAESDETLRRYAIEQTRTREPIFPSTVASRDLRSVRAIPNPYEFSAPWDQPARRKVQFVNLTEQATVRIYTTGGDLVRRLDHPEPGAKPGQGSIDWDLKNADGRLVAPGIYMYHVEAPGGLLSVQGRLIIIF